MKGYTATYKYEVLAGEPGWSWELIVAGRVVAEGWVRGRKRRGAELEVRETIDARDTLRACAGLV